LTTNDGVLSVHPSTPPEVRHKCDFVNASSLPRVDHQQCTAGIADNLIMTLQTHTDHVSG
jgi:hypothetical protein